jgi:hypothetical protein
MELVDNRPKLDKTLDADIFILHYYLKEEMASFCRENGLPASGNKQALKSRVELFLRTGKQPDITSGSQTPKPKLVNRELTLDTKIEENFCCTEIHRAFFESIIGKKFHFSVKFQKFLKANPGKTYRNAINEWYAIEEVKKISKGTEQIDSQFEYNTYIRDFFSSNKGSSLQDAIKCWKYKRNLPGTNKYEQEDLTALSNKLK